MSIHNSINVMKVLRTKCVKLQGEYKVFPCYKHLLQENYVEYKQTPQLTEFQPWISFQQDGAPP